MHRSIALVLAFGAATASADFKSDIGFTSLQSEFGATLPTGSNIRVAQVEWTDGSSMWAPQVSGDLAGKSITYFSTPTGYSGHANLVGSYLYGAGGSITPGISTVYSFEAVDYMYFSLGIIGSIETATWEVENHSYSGTLGSFDLTGARNLDYRLRRDNIVGTFSLDNTTGGFWPLYHQGYNGIVVGTATGVHSRGTTYMATAGRTKPDIVGVDTWTSYCAPIVASSGALLRSKAKLDSTLAAADNALVVKALLLAGADKSPFSGWAHTDTQPLDAVYGAGRVHIGNSYRTLVAGRSAASTSSWAGGTGWDAGTSSAGSKWYYFEVPAGSPVPFSAVLTWFAVPNLSTLAISVTNLDLKLWSATSGLATSSLVARSVSTIDNVEHIYVPSLAPGYYALEVVSPAAGEAYGLAWKGAAGGGSTPVETAPTITSQPSSQTVTSGNNASFSVTATGSGTLTYQWKKDGANVSGATGATLNLTAVTSGQAGSYTVVVTNSAGSVTSNAATLTVNPAPVAPTITSQPSSQTVTSGNNASFSVTATGTATLTYQWKKDGVNVSGATGATLNLTAVTSGQAGSYTVVVTNGVGSVTSNAATLTVNPAATAPSISTHPASQTVTAGGSVNFSVVATGSGTLTYQWKKDGTDISGATAWTYSIATVSSGHAGNYTVVVGNAAGSVTSNSATLTVNPAPVAPSITTQPVSVSVTAGGSTSFSVIATGTATLTYQWKKDGVNISGATGATLNLSGVTSGQAGSYTVVVTNGVGSVTSSAATLSIAAAATPPLITTDPASQTVTVGTTVNLWITLGGTFPITLQWYKDGVAVPGATDANFGLGAVTLGSAGTYKVIATNSAGSVTSGNAVITVNPAAVAPTISTQPVSQSVTAGNNVSFSVTAAGTATLTYQWKKDGSNIAGATSATLNLTAVTTGSAGNYTVVVTNGVGSVTSSTATLSVSAAPVAPTITSHPSSQTVTEGGSASFSVTATGTATLTFQWKKDGSNIGGATGATLNLSNVSSANAGSYTVVVTNGVGSVTSSAATLTVSSAVIAPAITLQPVSQSVTAGAAVSFSVTATGTATLTYQWKKDGVNVSGGTAATLSLGTVATTHAGSYTVVITNAAGSATSNAAVLSVSAAAVAPSITAQPAAQSGSFGGSVTFTVTATGTGTLSYQWRRNGSPISGATASTLVLYGLKGSDAGDYSVVVSNGAGSATSNVAKLTLTSDRQLMRALATRAVVGSGGDILISGFVIDGTSPKRLLVRASGPALASYGVGGTIAEPMLKVFTGTTQIAENQGWNTNANADEVRSVSASLGAFALPEGGKDSALLYTFNPGLYTVQVSGVGGAGGVSLIEVYDVDAGSGTSSLKAISSRAMVGTGSNILIPSLVVDGTGTKTVLVRAVGPALAKFGLGGVLMNPRLEVHKIGTDAVIASNQGWSNSADPAAIASVAATVGAFPLDAGSADCALLLTLSQGAYTFHVNGVGDTTGVALVEVYEL